MPIEIFSLIKASFQSCSSHNLFVPLRRQQQHKSVVAADGLTSLEP
jgi:hypothetical protein